MLVKFYNNIWFSKLKIPLNLWKLVFRISRERYSRKMSSDARFETVIEEKEDAC